MQYNKCPIEIMQKISAIFLIQLPSPILNQYYYYFTCANYFQKQYTSYYRGAINILNKLLIYINYATEKNIKVNCDMVGLISMFKAKYKSAHIPITLKNIEYVGLVLAPLVSKSLVSPIKPFMKQLLSQASNLVENEYFVVMNTFDQFFDIYIKESKYAAPLLKLAQQINNGNSQNFEKCSNALCRHFEATKQNEITLLNCSLIRYIFDVIYISTYSSSSHLENSSDNKNVNKFLKKCKYITCFTPQDLGINENLFTEEQHNIPVLSIQRDNDVVREMSNELNSLQFYTSPIDMLNVIAGVITKIDTFVKKNQIQRKLGKFSSMVDDDDRVVKKKRNEMMSFDDCFSLFFVILATNPPHNAVALSRWFEKLPRLPASMPMNVAKATFCSAVQHIFEFSDELIEKREQPDTDPLGIS